MSEKTNVVRIFERNKVVFDFHTYSSTGAISGVEVAKAIGKDCGRVFKTLVTVGKSGKNFVFVIPVAEELDLKKAADAVNEKSIEMLKQKDLLPTTGYVHGGCSPVGMKKQFGTVIHSSALDCETIVFSAGKIGYQVELPLSELRRVISFSTADIVA
jgi:ybaK/ebsC protein